MKQCKIYQISVLLMLLMVGCGSPKNEQKNRAKLSLNLGSDPQTLDPGKVRDTCSSTLMKMFFEGLTRIGKQDQAELALARSIEISEDLKKYVFSIRYSEWSNGEPLTVNDFIYAWKKVLDPKYPADNAFQLYAIKNAKAIKAGQMGMDQLGVRAIDPMTLEVELEHPTPYFLELMAFPTALPICQKSDEENAHWAESAATYVCNGPFLLKEWKHQDRLVAEKNNNYWDASHVKLDRLELVMVPEETEFKMYRKKQLDWAGSPLSTLSLDALPELKKSGEVNTKSILGTYFLRTNTEKPPFNNVKMRKAFALAIQREEIVKHITQGGQIPATGLVPLSFGLQKEPYFQDGAKEEAIQLFKEALEESGLSVETLPPITLSYRTEERNHLIAQALQDQWNKAFGIRIQIESVEKKVYFDRVSKQDYQLAAGSWMADYNDPVNFLDVFKYKKNSTNNTCWHNDEYEQLLDLSSTIMDPDKRSLVLAESEKILIDNMPIIPIFHFTMLYLHNPALKDVVLTSLGNLDFKWAYLENANQ